MSDEQTDCRTNRENKGDIACTYRPRGEEAEEKKTRKKAVKEERRVRNFILPHLHAWVSGDNYRNLIFMVQGIKQGIVDELDNLKKHFCMTLKKIMSFIFSAPPPPRYIKLSIKSTRVQLFIRQVTSQLS